MSVSYNYAQAAEVKLSNMEYLNTQHAENVINAVLELIIGEGDPEQERLMMLWRGIGMYSLLIGSPYYVAPDVCDLIANSSSELFDYKLQPEDLPAPAGFIHFSRPFIVESDASDPENLVTSRIYGISWITEGISGQKLEGKGNKSVTSNTGMPPSLASGVFLILWCKAEELGGRINGYPISFLVWKFGESPGVLANDPTVESFTINTGRDTSDPAVSQFTADQLGAFTATVLFMQQKIISVAEGTLPGNIRKRAEKAQVSDAEALKPIIVSFRKRKVIKAHSDEAHLEDRVPVEHDHRWLVTGHWRDQPYPSKGVIKKIWIAGHIKGPEDKPLVMHRERINAVVR